MQESSGFRSGLLRSPMLRAVLPFIGGCVIGHGWHVPLPWLWPFALMSLLIWVLASYSKGAYPRRWQRGASFAVFMCAFGLLWWRIHDPNERADHIARLRTGTEGWQCTVHEVIATNARTTRLWADVDAGIQGDRAFPASGRLLLTLLHDSVQQLPSNGAHLLVRAHTDTLDRVPDPGGFDVRSWAAGFGCWHGCFVPQEGWRITAAPPAWMRLFDSGRARISQWLERSGLPPRERGMAKAILLGLRDDLDQDQKTAFARSGTIHVLAVSGSHVGLIYALFIWALAFLGNRTRALLLRGVLVLIALWAYAGLTGFTPSVLRATITFSLFSVAEMVRWRTEPVNSLAGSAFLLLLWDPFALDQLSFQLSFLAVFGIALFYRPLMNAWAAPNRVLHYLWSLLAVSLSAQAFTTPLSLFVFKAFPLWFLPANMVIVGLVALGVYGGALLLVLHAVPVIGAAITWVMLQLLLLLGWCSAFFADLPGAYPSVRIDGTQCLLLYLLVLLLTAWYFERWRWARMGSALVLLVLFGSWVVAADERAHQQRIVLYDLRAGAACGIVEGRTLTVVCDTTDVWLRQRIEQHQRACGADRVRVLTGDPGIIQVHDRRLLFLHADDASDPRIAPMDVIVLGGAERFDTLRKEGLLSAGELVLAPDLRAHDRRAWVHWCKAHHMPVHDVRAQGAYVR